MATKEKLRTRAERAGEELRSTGRIILRSQALVHLSEHMIRFLLGAVLAGAEIFGGYAPCGLSMVGASGAGWGGFAALLGAGFGYLAFQGFTRGLRYVAAAMLVFSVSFAFYDVKLCRRAWCMPAVTALLCALTGFVYLSRRGWGGADTVFFATEVLLAGALTYFYRLAFSPWKRRGEDAERTARQTVSLLILGGSALITLSKVTILDGTVSLGRAAAALATMVTGYRYGAGTGAAAGVALGIAMDLAGGAVPFYVMSYGFSGLMIGLARRQNKLFAALGYVLADAAAVLWAWSGGARLWALYEVFIASVFFLLLPQRLFQPPLGAAERRQEGRDRATERAKARLETAAAAFRSMGETVRRAFAQERSNDADASDLFHRAAERVCRRCALQSTCWQRDYVTTFNALNDALPAMLERGRGEREDFPGHFSGRCLHFPAFLGAANEELTALLYRRQYRARLREDRTAVGREYSALAEVLGAAAAELSAELTPDAPREKRLRQHLAELGLAGEATAWRDAAGRVRLELAGSGLEALRTPEGQAELSGAMGVPLQYMSEEGQGDRLIFTQAEPLRAVAGVAAVQKDGQRVSGDAGAWFKLPGGVLWVLLCDGMGSGAAAREDSTLAARLLEQLLRAGMGAESALGTLDASLALRGEAQGGFSTVDLLRLDLFTGEGELYKCGGAPTYIRRGETVTRITGSALPAGLGAGLGGGPDRAAVKLAPGDLAVLVSDGVSAGGDDLWLRRAVGEFRGESPKDLARALVEAAEGGAAPDDKTALVLQLSKK